MPHNVLKEKKHKTLLGLIKTFFLNKKLIKLGERILFKVIRRKRLKSLESRGERIITFDSKVKKKKTDDPVNHPNHYQGRNGLETIDVMRNFLSKDGFVSYCIGNCLKYLCRYRNKNGIEDLKKAQVYLNWAIEEESKEDN